MLRHMPPLAGELLESIRKILEQDSRVTVRPILRVDVVPEGIIDAAR